MELDGEIYSTLTADDLERIIDHFNTELPKDFFKLDMVLYRPGREESEVRLQFLWVKARTVTRVTRLADGVEIVHCVSDGGRAVDIELGVPGGREIRPARIRVQLDRHPS